MAVLRAAYRKTDGTIDYDAIASWMYLNLDRGENVNIEVTDPDFDLRRFAYACDIYQRQKHMAYTSDPARVINVAMTSAARSIWLDGERKASESRPHMDFTEALLALSSLLVIGWFVVMTLKRLLGLVA